MYRHSTIPSEIKNYIRRLLASAILPENRETFLVHPGSDFTRNRKISLEDLVFHLFSRSSGFLTHNLQVDFGLGSGRPSKSALVQQLAKLKESFFRHLFESISARYHRHFLYKGRYRLLACDGSDISISSRNIDCYRNTNRTGKDFCSLHLNALYDILSGSFADCIIEKGKDYDETKACWRMMDKIAATSIVICDRHYESYNLFAHLEKAGHFYVIRTKDIHSTGMATYWWKTLDGPEGEGEVLVDTRITRVNSKAAKESGTFHPIPNNAPFDFLPEKTPFRQGRKAIPLGDIPTEHYHQLSFRLVRFRINPPGSPNEFETIATNLPADKFPAEELKRLYHLRWSEETGFRELKYDELLSRLHSVKADSVIKEIYVALTLHNMTSFLISFVGKKLSRGRDGKTRVYEVSHSDATSAVKLFLGRNNRCGPVKLMQELARNMEPVRDGRSFPRQLISKGFVAFTYRAA
ncbi:MAG: IS4 family transposase [Sphaerochaetaceae bacterium]|nr:IS4 family transposase [Sphaerochaetaceae bacterium]